MYAAACVSSYCYMCPYAAACVSSYCYINVLMLLYVCPHTAEMLPRLGEFERGEEKKITPLRVRAAILRDAARTRSNLRTPRRSALSAQHLTKAGPHSLNTEIKQAFNKKIKKHCRKHTAANLAPLRELTPARNRDFFFRKFFFWRIRRMPWRSRSSRTRSVN